jgi:DNA-binding GntR family transcriptional regulator
MTSARTSPQGRRAAGVRLPAEHELAAQYGVSRVTVRHSIKELVDEHLVEVVQGRGTFVTDLSPGERPALDEFAHRGSQAVDSRYQ